MELIKNNWKLKLLSLLGAIILWSFVISTENPTVNLDMRDIPVIFENEEKLNEKGLVLLTENRPKVNISVRGPRNRLVNITPQHIKVSADLTNYKEGLNPLVLHYDLPKDVELANEPATINVDIQKVIAKKFHVDVELNGNIQDGYLLESTKSAPEEISVKGPRSLVESITKLRAKLDAKNLTKDTVTNVDIEALTKDDVVVDNVILGQNFANISVVVSKAKEVSLIALTEGKLKDDLRIVSLEVEPKTLMVKGKTNKIDQIEEIPSKNIDISNITESTTIDLNVDLPTDVFLVNEDQKFKAKIVIEAMKEKTFSIASSKIKFTGASDARSAAIEEDVIQVKVKGFEEDLNQLTEDMIHLSYEVKDTSGVKLIRPTAKINSDKYKIVGVESIKINFE